MRALHGKIALAMALGVASLGLFGAAALGAFGPESANTVVSAVAPLASSVLGQDAKGGDKLKAILDGLVQKGVITQQQEDSILAAVKDATPARTGKVLRDLFGESAKYLGIPDKDLRAKLPGTSLGKIAESTTNKSRAGLVADLTRAANDDISNALTAKKITDAQAAKLRDGLASQINTFVDRTWPTKPTAAGRVPDVRGFLTDMSKTAQTFLGMSEKEIATTLRGGKSLADLANAKQANGRDALVATLTTTANAHIDAAVTANKITTDQAATFKSKVGTEISSFVDRRFPVRNVTKPTTPAQRTKPSTPNTPTTPVSTPGATPRETRD